MKEVFIANPYTLSTDMGSLGDASYVLIAQYQFPHFYDEKDNLFGADHDRCFTWDYQHARECCTRHMKSGEGHIATFARTSNPELVLAFIQDILKANPKVKWTGWRVMGTVNRRNGYPVYTLELFANNSGVEVFSGPLAPNVRKPKRT